MIKVELIESTGNDEELMHMFDLDKRKSLGCFIYSDADQNKYDDYF